MNIYLISQDANSGYDTYDSAVVAAETEEDARNTSPSRNMSWGEGGWWFNYNDGSQRHEGKHYAWSLPSQVTVKLIGAALPETTQGVICASFNAG